MFLLFPILLICGAIVTIPAAHHIRDVASREQSTAGNLESHGRLFYTFHVGEREYGGICKAALHSGQSVKVYYDPLHPTENALEDYATIDYHSWLRTAYVALFLGIAGIAVLAWKGSASPQ